MFDVLLVLVGLGLLIKGAGLLVAGSTAVARSWQIPPLVVGLTIVSFGTSMPELLVTMVAGLRGNSDLAIANVLGSNTANVLLVLGIAAIIRPLPVRNSTAVSEIPFSLTAALLVGFLANAALFSNRQELSISRLDGAVLLFFFLLFLLYVIKVSMERDDSAVPEPAGMPIRAAWLRISIGVVTLYLGGQWAVDGALGLAHLAGLQDAVIGLTIIAVGTSSPELVASAYAAWRNEPDLAVGNVVGSNIFNLLWILGITSSIKALPFTAVSNTDLVMVIVSSAMILVALVLARRRAIMRHHGVIFLLLYLGYLYTVMHR